MSSTRYARCRAPALRQVSAVRYNGDPELHCCEDAYPVGTCRAGSTDNYAATAGIDCEPNAGSLHYTRQCW